jgi:hypothetical protein
MGVKYLIAGWLLERIGHSRPLNMIRDKLASGKMSELGLKVRYGLFAGSTISDAGTWSKSDRLLKVLGLYEQHVQNLLAKYAPFERGLFIGSSDGYFPIGCLVAGIVRKAYCWDIDPMSHDALTAAAKENNVADKIELHFAATEELVKESVHCSKLNSNDLVIMDIEGSEFAILTDQFLASVGNALMIVELHPNCIVDGVTKIEAVLARAGKYGGVRVLTDEIRDVSGIRELSMLTDDERYLLCSEGRGSQMQWLVFNERASKKK